MVTIPEGHRNGVNGQPAMEAIFYIINAALSIYWWIIIASVIMSWLFAFGVVNNSNQFVNAVAGFLYDATEPVFARIRKFLPNLGAVDIAPIVVLVAITALQIFVNTTLARALLT